MGPASRLGCQRGPQTAGPVPILATSMVLFDAFSGWVWAGRKNINGAGSVVYLCRLCAEGGTERRTEKHYTRSSLILSQHVEGSAE
jgi:hypothetical protein